MDQKQCFFLLRDIMLCQKVNRKSKLIFHFLKYLNNVTLALDDTYAILNAGVVIE